MSCVNRLKFGDFGTEISNHDHAHTSMKKKKQSVNYIFHHFSLDIKFLFFVLFFSLENKKMIMFKYIWRGKNSNLKKIFISI